MLRQFGRRVEIRVLPAYNRVLLFAHVLDPIGAGARELPLTEKPPRISDLTRPLERVARSAAHAQPIDAARKTQGRKRPTMPHNRRGPSFGAWSRPACQSSPGRRYGRLPLLLVYVCRCWGAMIGLPASILEPGE